MSKRARYDGPSGTGVDLLIPLPDGQEVPVHVDQGHQLPAEVEWNGEKHPVPAAFRDSLLEQADIWSEVSQATGSDTKKGA